ncbi:hypothetical protein CC78DRAFT_603860 [Lojkania enalia]|uniref:Uncharacterized protein n=1 Tax=Lojkania enalia TaxID=147567 RepID=A0A9P4N2H6_9PLEO|nr:hypothetical protein CC78DRAFT_603860 [Didymosphaeria enalia]
MPCVRSNWRRGPKFNLMICSLVRSRVRRALVRWASCSKQDSGSTDAPFCRYPISLARAPRPNPLARTPSIILTGKGRVLVLIAGPNFCSAAKFEPSWTTPPKSPDMYCMYCTSIHNVHGARYVEVGATSMWTPPQHHIGAQPARPMHCYCTASSVRASPAFRHRARHTPALLNPNIAGKSPRSNRTLLLLVPYPPSPTPRWNPATQQVLVDMQARSSVREPVIDKPGITIRSSAVQLSIESEHHPSQSSRFHSAGMSKVASNTLLP